MEIVETEEFTNSFNRLPNEIKKKVKKQLAIFLSDFKHPSLCIKKLKSKQDIWYGRIDLNYRFTFQIERNNYILLSVGLKESILRKS